MRQKLKAIIAVLAAIIVISGALLLFSSEKEQDFQYRQQVEKDIPKVLLDEIRVHYVTSLGNNATGKYDPQPKQIYVQFTDANGNMRPVEDIAYSLRQQFGYHYWYTRMSQAQREQYCANREYVLQTNLTMERCKELQADQFAREMVNSVRKYYNLD